MGTGPREMAWMADTAERRAHPNAMWSGARSIELGLVDGYGTVDSVARDVIKASEVRDFSIKQNFAEKFAKQFGAQRGESLSAALTQFTLR